MATRQSARKTEMAEEIRSAYIKRKRSLRRRHVRWMETLYAIHGDQHRVMKGDQIIDLSALQRDDVDGIRVTHNHLFQSFRAMIATALQSDPTPVVAISRPGRDARQLSRAAERLLQWMYHDKNFRRSVRSALSWTFTCGVGFIGSMWDLGADDPTWVPEMDNQGNVLYSNKKQVMRDEGGDMVLSEYGTPLTEEVLAPKGAYKLLGDLRFFSPPPFDVFPQQCRTWEDCRDLIIRQYMTKAELEETFGKAAKNLVPDVRSDDFIRFDEYEDPSSSNRVEDLVVVLTRYTKPDLKNPDGKYCVMANDVLLHEGPLPGGQLPIAPIYDNEHPAHLFGESALYQALEVQRDINAAEADLKMDRRLHAHPRLIVEQGSLVKGVTRVPNVPGAVMEVRPNSRFQPQFLSSPPLPGWVEKAPDRLQKVLEDITGTHGLSKGSQAGIMSGRQASVVLAADRAKWGPTIKSMAEAVEYVSELALSLWRLHGPIEKTVDVYGPTGTPMDTMVFMRDFLPDRIRVRVETSTMMPYNEEIRRQQLNEAWQIGAIPDLNMYWKLQRHGEMGRLLGTDEPSRARARQENDVLDNGGNVRVEQHEDHEAHMDEHLERMRDPGWYALPEQSRLAYRVHVAQHQTFVQNAQNPVLTGASQMPGLPQDGAQLQNLPPSMNGAEGQATMPGVSSSQEAMMLGGG